MEVEHPCGCLVVHGNINGTAEHVNRMCLRHYEEWRKRRHIYSDPLLYIHNLVISNPREDPLASGEDRG